MSSDDDLRKLLNAAQGYNRFMERRVRFLEAELQQHDPSFMLAEKEHASEKLNEKHRHRSANKDEASGDNKDGFMSFDSDDLGSMSRGALVEEVLRIRQVYKAAWSELKKLRKEKSVLQANCQSLTTQLSGQRNKIDGLMEENISLRALLPSHFFDDGRSISSAGTESKLADPQCPQGGGLDTCITAVQQVFGEINARLLLGPESNKEASTVPAVLAPETAAKTVTERADVLRCASLRLLHALQCGRPTDGEYEEGGRKRRCDGTLRQAEGLLRSAEEGVEALRILVVEIPRVVASYTAKCRGSVTLVVEGQGTTGLVSVAKVRSQAEAASADLRKCKEDFQNIMRNLRNNAIIEANMLMACVSAAIGISLYRPNPQCHALISQLEEEAHKMVGLDVSTEGVLKREGCGALLAVTTEMEHTLREMAAVPDGADRFRRLDISDIHRMAQDAASIAMNSGVLGEITAALEVTKSAVGQVVRLIRGELVAHSFDDRFQQKGIQCNLQQQKLLMTENELAIARLASIRSNWFDAAMIGHEQENSSTLHPSSPPLTGRLSAKRSPTPAGVRSSKVSPADIARLLKMSIQKHKLIVPPNFAPVAGDYRGGEVKYHFGRKVVALHALAGGSQVAVHVGGGYITFEEYCLKNALAETRMMDVMVGGAVTASASPKRAESQPHASASPPAVCPSRT
jgi:hypothetical protein